MDASELAGLRQTLETAIDKHGLRAIVSVLSDLCGDKADHLRTNWQDQDLDSARCWDVAQRDLDRAMGGKGVRAVS